MEKRVQHTLLKSVDCHGVSLHKGEQVRMRLHPAPEDSGITFIRTDIANKAHREVRADYRNVTDTTLCTVLENVHGVRVSTVEHLMAALWGCGVDNVLIEIDGAEVPIMDGSAEPFMFLIECAGIVEQSVARRYIIVDAPISVHDGDATAMLYPAEDEGFTLDVNIDFAHESIGAQVCRFVSEDTTFRQSLSRARTFGFLKDVEKLRSIGLARGGSLHNAIVVDDNGIVNHDGLRHDNEFARHKALDCIGDYFLAGHRIIGRVKTTRPGHGLNNRLIKALFSQPNAWHFATRTSPASSMPAFMANGQVTAAQASTL